MIATTVGRRRHADVRKLGMGGRTERRFFRTTLFVDGLAPCKPIDGSDHLCKCFASMLSPNPNVWGAANSCGRACYHLMPAKLMAPIPPDDRMPLRGRTVPPSTA